MRFSTLLLGGFAVFVYGTGVSLTALYFKKPEEGDWPTDDTRISTFDSLSPSYDSKLNTEEFVMGLSGRRKKLMSSVHGDVLEVSAGSGRNLPYLGQAKDMTSYTACDASHGMIDVLKAKCAKNEACKLLMSKNCFNAVEARSEKLPFPDNSFDTVVDCFGLCSVSDPEGALKEMRRILRPGGKMILLEHGLTGKRAFIDDYLHKHALGHVRNWGCFWNRPIPEYVAKLENPPAGDDHSSSNSNIMMKIESESRFGFGTNYLYSLRKVDYRPQI
jgi:methyltransferase OMS1, mitochondrial